MNLYAEYYSKRGRERNALSTDIKGEIGYFARTMLKKGMSLGAILTQIDKKYPNRDALDLAKIVLFEERRLDSGQAVVLPAIERRG